MIIRNHKTSIARRAQFAQVHTAQVGSRSRARNQEACYRTSGTSSASKQVVIKQAIGTQRTAGRPPSCVINTLPIDQQSFSGHFQFNSACNGAASKEGDISLTLNQSTIRIVRVATTLLSERVLCQDGSGRGFSKHFTKEVVKISGLVFPAQF